MTTPKRPDPVARRKPTPRTRLSSAQLDRLAEITPEDVESARARFREDAPLGFGRLLDATEDDE